MENNELTHHGILGMKWGRHRYQNKDGSLNSDGKIKYQSIKSDSSVTKKVKKDLSKMTGKEFKNKYHVSSTTYMKRVDKFIDPYMNSPLAKIGKKLAKNKGKERTEQLIEKFGNKYTMNKNTDGSIYLQDGKDVWKID